jgi:hypothetical protein
MAPGASPMTVELVDSKARIGELVSGPPQVVIG